MKKIFIAILLLNSTMVCFASKPIVCTTTPQVNLKQAVKWYHDSAEKKVLYREIYNVGTDYVTHWVLTHHPKPKTWGVVLDIDETTLDNSWYFHHCRGCPVFR